VFHPTSSRVYKPVAAKAAHEMPVAMQLRQELRVDARPAMKVIGVLRDKKLELADPLELDEG
jgi:hypothetical protein